MPEKISQFFNFVTLPTISPPGNGDPLGNLSVHFNVEMTTLRLPQSRCVGFCQRKAAMPKGAS